MREILFIHFTPKSLDAASLSRSQGRWWKVYFQAATFKANSRSADCRHPEELMKEFRTSKRTKTRV